MHIIHHEVVNIAVIKDGIATLCMLYPVFLGLFCTFAAYSPVMWVVSHQKKLADICSLPVIPLLVCYQFLRNANTFV